MAQFLYPTMFLVTTPVTAVKHCRLHVVIIYVCPTDALGILASHCPLHVLFLHLYQTNIAVPSQSLAISAILAPHSGQSCRLSALTIFSSN
jgi:hypothetical protein